MNKISPFETLRYLNNCYSLITLIIAIALLPIFDKINKKSFLVIPLSILVMASFVLTIQLRREFSNVEEYERFKSPKKVLSYLSDKSDFTLVAEDIIIYQILGSKDLKICNVFYMGTLLENKSKDQIYLYSNNFLTADYFRLRYPEMTSVFNNFEMELILSLDDDRCLYEVNRKLN